MKMVSPECDAGFLRNVRREVMTANGWSLRELYCTFETRSAS